MTDPRDHAQRHEARPGTPGTVGPERTEGEPRNDADELTPDGEVEKGPDANDLDADIAVEEDTIKTVDPDNPQE
ncbi:hypothetical protein ACFWN7_11650 [Agromyces sp. NPDC058484]|uniref:hypothetical protein n=1 Tax=Agromyces sp. NPDC058484 TaxID=3346524 RepID=UPI0036536383